MMQDEIYDVFNVFIHVFQEREEISFGKGLEFERGCRDNSCTSRIIKICYSI